MKEEVYFSFACDKQSNEILLAGVHKTAMEGHEALCERCPNLPAIVIEVNDLKMKLPLWLTKLGATPEEVPTLIKTIEQAILDVIDNNS